MTEPEQNGELPRQQQHDLVDQLSHQVQDALGLLLHELARADAAADTPFLAGYNEAEIFEASAAFVMRQLFALYAEANGLLPAGRTLHDPARYPLLQGHAREDTRSTRQPAPPPIRDQVIRKIRRCLKFAGPEDARQPLNYTTLQVEQLGHLYEGLLDLQVIHTPDGLRLTLGGSRQSLGAHYTPTALTEPLVRDTLQPLLEAERPTPTPEMILALKVCDPAMGAGAFLVQAVRYLAERLVHAWEARALEQPGVVLSMPLATPRDGGPEQDTLPHGREERLVWARRYVAHRCIHGVDLNREAVEMARLSLWCVTASRDDPFTFLDHALRPGDALVRPGADAPSSSSFSWEREFPKVFHRRCGGFDAFIGNPPWGAHQTPSMKQYLKRSMPEVDSSTPDSFAYFLGLALAHGSAPAIGFLLPDSFLTKDFGRLREILLPKIRSIRWYENASVPRANQMFVGVQMDVCALVVSPVDTDAIDIRVHRLVNGEWSTEVPVMDKVSLARPELGTMLNLTLRPADVRAWEQVRRMPKLGDVVSIHEGIHSGNIRDHLFVPQRRRGDEKPLFVGARAGDHVEDFFAVRGGWFVDYRPELAHEVGGYASLREPSIFLGPKVYLTRTGNPFKAFVNREDFASNNFFSLQFRDRAHNTLENLTLLAAFVRSPLAQYLVRVHVAPRLGKAFTETKIKHIKALPFELAAIPPADQAFILEAAQEIGRLKRRRYQGDDVGEAIAEATGMLDRSLFSMLGFSAGQAQELLAHRALH